MEKITFNPNCDHMPMKDGANVSVSKLYIILREFLNDIWSRTDINYSVTFKNIHSHYDQIDC